jgi:transglutaminase-like putative cysteine protease
MPYPREGHKRQELVSFDSDDTCTISYNSNLQRSVYFEKKAVKDQPTIFKYDLILSNKSVNFNINPNLIEEYDKKSDIYKKYTIERSPHILFTEKVKTLSNKIIGEETNPYIKAKKIFKWISKNIPWAGAREYSTILNISDYCITNMHGDCGIKTILFMTLARYNGIPTKWQSGWMLHPGEVNLHDWCEAYFEGYGWVPVDQSFGLVDSDNEKVKYFYLGGIDQYRFIVNDDYSSQFAPQKEHPRSETVDFQRGEVEWSGSNLYFDKWDYSMELEYLDD